MTITLLSLFLSGVTVTLPMEATVRGTEVELGEIATVEGGELEVVQRLESLELGYAPGPGYSRLLVRERVEEIVRRQLPDLEVRFRGERACRVRPAVAKIAEADILAAARAELTLRFVGTDATFEPSDRIPPIAVPEGSAVPRLRARVTSTELASSTVNVPVEILVDGVVYRTVWTSWRAQVWRTMPVLAHPVKSGESLHAGLFETRRVRWQGASAPALPGSSLGGAVATRDLDAGVVVTGHDVHRPVVLTAGSMVFVRVKKGPIEARTAAHVLDSGSVGDRVRIRTTNGAQEFFATVLSGDLVEVVLGR